MVINRATRFVPARSDDQRIEDVAYFNSVLNRHGLTTVYDVGRASDGNFDPVRELANSGELTLRVFHSLRYQANNPLQTTQAKQAKMAQTSVEVQASYSNSVLIIE